MGTRRRLVHDRAARADLIDIWIYSLKTWGEAQADRYLGDLEQSIAAIANDPARGVRRDSLSEGYRSVRSDHHVVFYTFDDSEVRVRRVLHAAMDEKRHL